MSLRAVSDEFLARRAAQGDAPAFAELARRYAWLLLAVSKHPPAGVAFEDLYQEALMGLLHACQVHRPPMRGHFKGLVGLSVRWWVRRARAAALRGKHRFFNDAIREDDEPELWGAQASRALEGTDPAVLVEAYEQLRERAEPMRQRASAPGGDRRRRYSDEQITRALALLADGKTPQQTALAVGATPARVRAWAARAGQRHSGRHCFTEAEIQHALSLVEAGASLSQAGAAVGAHHTTVLNWRRKAA